MDCEEVDLKLYISKTLPIEQLNILLKKTITTPIGKLTAAVIGSSHFLKLNDNLFEILTCQHLKIPSHDLFYDANACKQLNYKFKDIDFDYFIEIDFLKYNKQDFLSKEAEISKSDSLLIYAFEPNSAYTIIENPIFDNNKMIIETWHTYPEYLTIIKTKTQYSTQTY